MTDAPERIMAQDTDTSDPGYTGGGWWDELPNNDRVQHSGMTEYIRADLVKSLHTAEEQEND